MLSLSEQILIKLGKRQNKEIIRAYYLCLMCSLCRILGLKLTVRMRGLRNKSLFYLISINLPFRADSCKNNSFNFFFNY